MAGRFNPEAINEMPDLFLQIVMTSIGAAVLPILFTGRIKKLLVKMD